MRDFHKCPYIGGSFHNGLYEIYECQKDNCICCKGNTCGYNGTLWQQIKFDYEAKKFFNRLEKINKERKEQWNLF